MSLHRLHEEIKSRKIRRALAIYVGFALPAVGIASMLENRYGIEHVWFDRLLIALAFGLFTTVVVAWFHGKAKVQRFHGPEVVLYLLLWFCAAAAIVFLPRSSGPGRPLRATPDKSIAVLPFKNFSSVPGDGYFADGITEDILTQLSKIADLRVISRTTVMRYRETSKSLSEIGQELNVGTILEGSVRKEGNRVRVVGQLIDARSDEHLWAETFDRDLKDIFAIQSEIARNIASALKAVLTPPEEARLAKPPTESIDAYALYLQGRQHYGRYTAEENEKAIDFFLQAIALDSSFGLAYAGLSDAYSQRVLRSSFTVDWLDSAVTAAEHAIRLTPESAEAYKALGLAFDMKGLRNRALELYEKSVDLNPNSALALRNIGLLDYHMGRLDRGYAAALKVVSLAPDDVMGFVQVGLIAHALELDSVATAWYSRARRIAPDNPFPLLGRGWQALTGNDLTQARQISDTLLVLAPSLPPAREFLMNIELVAGRFQEAYEAYEKSGTGPSAHGAFILQKLGRRKEALRTASEGIQRMGRLLEPGGEEPTLLWETASCYTVLEKPDSALLWSARAIESGWRDYRWALRDPLFESLNYDEKFREQMANAKSRVASMREAALQISP